MAGTKPVLKMRIAYVVTEYVTESNFSGGLANYTHRAAKSMLMKGHVPEIFVLSNEDCRYLHDGILVHRIRTKKAFWLRLIEKIQDVFFLGYFKRIPFILSRIISLQQGLNRRHMENPFNIVHYTHLMGTALLRSKVPCVVRLSSYAELLIPYGFQFSSCFERWVEDVAIRRADAVISPSYFVADYVKKKLNKSVYVIESPFLPREEKDEDDSILINMTQSQGFQNQYGLYFGSIAEWKGVFVLVEALAKLLIQFPSLGFVFIGRDLFHKNGVPASQYIKKALSSFEGRVFIFPPLRHSQLFPFIRKALFVALPSLMDNFPNTCLESMWMRKVVIGTRGRSFDQLITHRENGLLCEPGDIGSLLTCMREAISLDTIERNKIGELAHKRIEMLSPEIIGKQLEKFYLNTLSIDKISFSQKEEN
jgi:glycogen synthase